MLDPVTLRRGRHICNAVRFFFAEGVKEGEYGLKSSNKNYAKDAPVGLERIERRNENAEHSRVMRERVPRLAYKQAYSVGAAELLLAVKAGDRAGNCSEMAVLAAYVSLTDYHFARELLYLAQLAPPGDHMFCLLVDAARDRHHRDWDNLVQFAAEPKAQDWMVIDPWLNVCCRANEYPDASRDKFDKWMKDGKRIEWTSPTSKQKGWYPPKGQYAEVFCNKANVGLEEFLA